VKILKNSRERLIHDGVLASGVAPSYYLEGQLYNVPNDLFGISYETSIINAVNYILQADRSEFVCPNRQYLLLEQDPNVSWNSRDCDQFLNALISMWQQW